MSWNEKDYKRSQPKEKGGRPKGRRGPLPEAIPTVIEELSWGAQLDEEDVPLTPEQRREWQAMGMVTDQEWGKWSTLARRGVEPYAVEQTEEEDEDESPPGFLA